MLIHQVVQRTLLAAALVLTLPAFAKAPAQVLPEVQLVYEDTFFYYRGQLPYLNPQLHSPWPHDRFSFDDFSDNPHPSYRWQTGRHRPIRNYERDFALYRSQAADRDQVNAVIQQFPLLSEVFLLLTESIKSDTYTRARDRWIEDLKKQLVPGTVQVDIHTYLQIKMSRDQNQVVPLIITQVTLVDQGRRAHYSTSHLSILQGTAELSGHTPRLKEAAENPRHADVLKQPAEVIRTLDAAANNVRWNLRRGQVQWSPPLAPAERRKEIVDILTEGEPSP